MVKNPPANAGDWGPMRSGGIRIPHAVGQPSPRATTIEPEIRSPRALELSPAAGEATTGRPWTAARKPSPLATARESASAAKTRHSNTQANTLGKTK